MNGQKICVLRRSKYTRTKVGAFAQLGFKKLPKYAGKEKLLIEDVLSSVKKTIERSNKKINEITVFIQ